MGPTMKTGPTMNEDARELDFGTFRIRPEVLEEIAGMAATSVDGVASLTGGPGARGGRGRRAHSRGVHVDVAEGDLSVRLHIEVRYGMPIPDVGADVQRSVADALRRMTGTQVDHVEVFVDGVMFEQA
jgi:uncharacterized alkaline shock family protein YloU